MIKRCLLVSTFILMFVCTAFSQIENEPIPTLESPYNTVYIHLYYLQADSYHPEIAAKAIVGTIDSLERIQAAVQLKRILDGKGLYVHLNLLPQESDFIDSLTKKPFYTPFPDELPQVYLERINGQWFYSSETVSLIPKLYKEVYPFGTDWLMNLLPANNQQHLFGLALWQYLGILFLFLFVWIVHLILSKLLFYLVRRLARSRWSNSLENIHPINQIARALSLLLLSILVKMLLPILQLPINTAKFSILSLKIVITVFAVLLALRILDLVMVYATTYAKSTEKKLDEQLLPIVNRMLYILFVIGGIIQVLRILEVNVTALVAGISIGGLALALAAQDTVKNLIGSAMIFIDKPFQIGDYIEGSSFVGTVMEVGFRTTRIQTTDTSIISVPNGSIANMAITNKGVRVFRLFATELGLTYNSSPERIQLFITSLRQLIENHPRTRKEGYYVHFNSMQASSLNIFFRVFLEVNDYAEELKIKEEFLFGFLRLAQLIGLDFAFPSSSIYVENFPGQQTKVTPSKEENEPVEEQVAAFLKNFAEKNRDDAFLN